jgi:two-component system chemotaxis response regulator CheB
VDYNLPVAQIGSLLQRLAQERVEARDPANAASDCPDAEAEPDEAEHDLPRVPVLETEGVASGSLCPDCGGPLWEASAGAGHWLTCRVGHQWSGLASLTDAQAERLEELAWGLVNALAERALLLRQVMAEDSQLPPGVAGQFAPRCNRRSISLK